MIKYSYEKIHIIHNINNIINIFIIYNNIIYILYIIYNNIHNIHNIIIIFINSYEKIDCGFKTAPVAAIPVNPYFWSKSAEHDVTLTSFVAEL